MRFSCVLVLLVISGVSLGQSDSGQPVGNEEELLSALLAIKTGDAQRASALLKDHRNLVTPRLGYSLLQAATLSAAIADPIRSLFVSEIAKQIATQLGD